MLFPLTNHIGTNPGFWFSREGIVAGGKTVRPWEQITKTQRVPAKMLFLRKPHEALRIYITQDPLPPLTGIRSWLREKGIIGGKPAEYGVIVNTPDYIDRVVAAMVEYSGKDLT